jgi:bifunctional non-homologous end joining protein LigD
MESLPRLIEPMGVAIAERPFSAEGWAFEPKLDGYRGVAYLHGGEVRIQTRNGMSAAKLLPDLCADIAGQRRDALILDGELVAFDDSGRQSFAELQTRFGAKSAGKNNVAFYCFDILHLDGVNPRDMSYTDRRALLTDTLRETDLVKLVHAQDDGPALYDASLAAGLEGVVAKRKASRYCPGKKTQDWLKVKPFQTGDYAIVGYLANRDGLQALLLAEPVEHGWRYVGRVGAAMSRRDATALFAKLQALAAAEPTVANPPSYRPAWVVPRIVCEVRYFEILHGKLRHAVFSRLRPDLSPSL